MLMLRKKKLKIAKMLATLLYRGECDLEIPYNAFCDISETTINMAYEIGGLAMLDSVYDWLSEMRRSGEG